MLLKRNVQPNRIDYTINNSRRFQALGSLTQQTVGRCKQFAYNMSFGNQGQHRANRTGGRNIRRNGEIFCDAFNGKLGEFAVHQLFANQGIQLPEPDLTVYGLGQWDDTDFSYNDYCIAIKTTKNYGNLLLLEREDWDHEGHYIPNYDKPSGGRYDAIVLVRINSDIETRFKTNRRYFNDTLTEAELNQIFSGFSCSFDIPGYTSSNLLRQVINNNQIIEQGSYLNRNTRMDATNYYIQTGDLLPINRLVHQLTDNVFPTPIL